MARIYIGNIGIDCRESDVEKLFKDYGRITDIHLKDAYGFLNFDDKRDASDAIKEVNGKMFNGGRIRVDYAKEPRGGGGRDRWGGGGGGRDDRGGRDRWGGGGRDRNDRGGRGGERRERNPPGKWTNYRLLVQNLSSKTSWQDLKDYMREAGDITFTKAHSPRSGDGVVEFAEREGMEYALKKLDDTELDGRKIRLVEETGHGKGGTRSRTRSRSRSRSNSRRRKRSRSSHSRSKSTDKKATSRSRSYDRSKSNDRKNRFDSKKGKDGSRSPFDSKKGKDGSRSPQHENHQKLVGTKMVKRDSPN